jgi:hypothetical protein
MTATVFLILLFCLLATRFFLTCLIVLLIGIFILSDHPAHAGEIQKCDPAFVRMNATLVQATMTCDKDYMDTKMGMEAAALSHQCDSELGMPKVHAIMRKAIRHWESIAKEKGKKDACAWMDGILKTVEEVVIEPPR